MILADDIKVISFVVKGDIDHILFLIYANCSDRIWSYEKI